MFKASPASNTSQSAQLLAALTGIAFGATTYLTLMGIILYFKHADPDIFGVRMLIACLSSIILFSSQQLLGTLQEKNIFSAFPSITARWFVVFMIVLLSAYVDKTAEQLSRAIMLAWLVITPFTLTFTALIVRSLAVIYFSNPSRRRKAVLIWSNSACADLVESLRDTPLAAIDFVGFFDNRNESRPPSNLERLGDLSDAANWIVDAETGRVNVDVVFIGLNTKEPPELAEIIAILEDSTASTYFVPESLIFGMPGIQLRELAGRPVLASTETPFIGLAALPKRLLDLFGSAVGLVVLSPLLLMIAIGVKLGSPGPVFFKQKRYGIAGRPINVYKFRSMRQSAPDAPVIQATVGDPRVTRFGRFLRRSSLDELPQLFNVLKGEMSLVGPRPHAIEHNELYRKLVSGYMFRHKIKPGITGWAQVNGLRGETETLEKMEERVNYDLYYIQHWSVWLDLVIIWRTFKVVLGDKNAY
ncbi:undecaprenyl-phosphate glucose phosphotransferase [Undibacterium sp. TS12]|uniref:undecaprenyl-phosphate glucose phosphotransferase n=1 Tax=Undibacterium sp. TS12 TaxID=2908202 RepID=UPI001F4C739A|nr:undecaprenyl-phosphate glucose phosphotransferase [Undibacterium sp. TS12]MCH8620584.1 undecaprenyl-phosphate glucose phosphotransferase [Undibacterium sp. TS12]